jgi:hypothetical protein
LAKRAKSQVVELQFRQSSSYRLYFAALQVVLISTFAACTHLVSYLFMAHSTSQVTNRVIEAILAEMNHLVSLDLQDEDLLHRLNEGFRRKPNGIARGCMQWCN